MNVGSSSSEWADKDCLFTLAKSSANLTFNGVYLAIRELPRLLISTSYTVQNASINQDRRATASTFTPRWSSLFSRTGHKMRYGKEKASRQTGLHTCKIEDNTGSKMQRPASDA